MKTRKLNVNELQEIEGGNIEEICGLTIWTAIKYLLKGNFSQAAYVWDCFVTLCL